MSLFDRLLRRPTQSLRIGRHAVERWEVSREGRGLALEARVPLPAEAWHQPSLLTAAIGQACTPSAKAGGIELVLESAWLPLLVAPTGEGLVSQAQAEALVRHRLQRLYDSPSDPVAAWDVRVDFRAGDAQVLGYGLSPRVHQALARAAEALGLEWRAITPAFSWGCGWTWSRLKPIELVPGRAAWWCWQEQDRWMLAHLVKMGSSRPRIVSLHPALADAGDVSALRLQVQAEAVRLGLPSVPTALRVGGWAQAPWHASDPDVRWLHVGSEVSRGLPA